MKKNKVLLLGIITVFVAIFSLTLVSGTWAKYTSTVSGADNAKVAKWEWKVSDLEVKQGMTSTNFKFDLFNTIKDTAGADETDVKENLIAPGTSGEFSFNIANLSEVNAKYYITFEVTQDGTAPKVPLKFKLNDAADWSDTLTGIAEGDAVSIAMETGTGSVKVQWQWAFEGGEGGYDATDTTIGFAAPNVTVNATLVMVQVD